MLGVLFHGKRKVLLILTGLVIALIIVGMLLNGKI